MTFDDAALMSYLVTHLQPLTEADPNLLANYVAALLKNNKSKKELHALCVNQLLDFLGDKSNSFVVNLFHALEDGSIIMQQDNHCTAYENSGQASATPKSEDNMESRTQQSEIPSKLNLGISSEHEDHDEDFSDDEDDDRNHKHRRHVSRSCSPEKDVLEEPVRKRIRPTSDTHPELGISRSNDDLHIEKDRPVKKRPGRDYVYSNPPKLGGENSLHGMARRPSAFRGDVCASRLECQNGMSRGVIGRSRGANPFILAREQRMAPLDVSDYNMPILPVPSSTYAGRTSSNSAQSSWAGYVQFNGVTNGAFDQTLSLNTGMQGSRGASVSAAVGVGMNIVSFGRPRCPDFEERGYCLRGDLCPLEHGANRIVVKDVQSLSKFNLPMAHSSGRTNAPGPASNSVSYSINVPSLDKATISKEALVANTEPDLYDPDQPLWNKNQASEGLRKLPVFRRNMEDNVVSELHVESNTDEVECDVSQHLAEGKSNWHCVTRVDQGDIEIGITRSNRSLQHSKAFVKLDTNDKEKHEKTTFMSDIDNVSDKGRHPTDKGGFHLRSQRNPVSVHERALRTLFVGCIPRNINKKEILKAHFQKFGEIMDIRIASQGDRAFVQFLQPEDAEAALKSPEAVMGNRFIKLSWAKRDNLRAPNVEGRTESTSAIQKTASPEAVVQKGTVLGEKQLAMASPGFEHHASEKQSVISTPEPSISQKKREELEHLKEALRKKQEELAQKRDEFRRKLETLSKQNVGVTGEIDMVNTESNFIKEELKGEHSNDGIVKVKGMDGDVTKQIPSWTDKGLQVTAEPDDLSQPPSCSAQMSTGSIALSSRSVKTRPSWSVASSASQCRGPFWNKIDNRSTVFQIVPPFPDNSLDLTTLKEHFLQYGELISLELDEVDQNVDGYRVTFSSRSAAELAFTQGKWFQGSALQFCWVNPSSSIVAVSSTGNRNVEVTSENIEHRSAQKSSDGSKSSKFGGSTAEDESNDNASNTEMFKLPDGGHDPCIGRDSVDNITLDV